MAEDKKRNALFSRLLNKKPSDDKCFESEEEFSDNNDPELNENAENNEAENNSTLEWLSDVMTESPEEPEEDISEALAELFGDNKEEAGEETEEFGIPGLEELTAEGVANYDLYDLAASDGDVENTEDAELSVNEISEDNESVSDDIGSSDEASDE